MTHIRVIIVLTISSIFTGQVTSKDFRTYIHCIESILSTYDPNQPYASTFNSIPLEPSTAQLWHGQPGYYTSLAIKQWMKRQPEVLKRLLPAPTRLSTALDEFNRNHTWLLEQGIRNISTHNYVFDVPELPRHYIKISGAQHRLVSLIVGAGYESFIAKDPLYVYPGEINSLIYRAGIPLIDSIERVPTYQTISQYAYCLLIQEAITKYHLYTISVPWTELFQLVPGPLCDETCIIVQEKITVKSINKLRSEAIIHLIILILATGLWDLHEGNIISHKKGITLVDLEQPNRYAPQEFLHKNPTTVLTHICEGLESLSGVLKKRAGRKQFKMVQMLIRYILKHSSPYACSLNEKYGSRLRAAYRLD